MNKTHKSSDPTSDDVWALTLPGTVLVLVALLVAVDLFSEIRHGLETSHIVIETLIVLVAGSTSIWLWVRASKIIDAVRQQARADVDAAQADVARWKLAAEGWKAENQNHVAGLSEAIDRQFAQWDLSPAEAEVALLLLKGLQLKEVAEVRGVSERTVRDQARAVYRKAELANRSELAAFFLEDLLAPRHPTSTL